MNRNIPFPDLLHVLIVSDYSPDFTYTLCIINIVISFLLKTNDFLSRDNVGKEVISKFTSDLKTDGIFYTDSNGREILQRKRDYRPTWTVNISEPVSANYYPVTSRIVVRDAEKKEVAVLTDRAQGGTSMKDGEIELMVSSTIIRYS